ncbi:MAG: sel1 repeat family protein [Candidatus Methanomethylophilaceae archaeon]|nr:sel1 repeat family protein [Candidatus Methanomethylophilaceae archaeon]
MRGLPFKTVKCPQCEKVLQLDSDLETGYCMYCGARIVLKDDEVPDIDAIRARAEQGDVSAQYDLATIYRYGKGVDQDNEEAVKWYKMAAEQGDPYAMYNLGIMCSNGLGIKRNCSVAARYFEEANKHGFGKPLESRKG